MSAERPKIFPLPTKLRPHRIELASPFAVKEVLVAGNRGPCGGVNMALEATNQVLDIVQGRELVYANWDVVNNTPIMNRLRGRGLIGVQNNWDLVPDGSIMLFSAHGVPPEFYRVAKEKDLFVIDVTCQLVDRVHSLVTNAVEKGNRVIYVGSKSHPETIGILGEGSPQQITLIETFEDVDRLEIPQNQPAIVYSQTTLSTIELKDIYRRLKERFPHITIPPKIDICYAADNRQAAMEDLIDRADLFLVVGSRHSHNSEELRRMGEKTGKPSYMVDIPEEIELPWFGPTIKTVGVSSGASVLDEFTEAVLDWFRNRGLEPRYLDQIRNERVMTFRLPTESIARLEARYAA